MFPVKSALVSSNLLEGSAKRLERTQIMIVQTAMCLKVKVIILLMKLWSLIVRTVSYLFIASRLEEFPITLASTIEVLDEMMKLEDIKLKTMLESYGQMDLARKGTFPRLTNSLYTNNIYSKESN